MARTLAVLFVAVVAVSSYLGRPVAATAATPSRAACAGIVAEFHRQGAPAGVAARFGQIAWRESGCVMQCVHNRTDHSCSRLGLNMRGAMPRYWARLCGARSVNDTKALSTDVRCALAAYRHVGWRPWR